MTAFGTALIVLLCLLGGAVFGARLGAVLPHAHLSSDSKDVIRFATGILATLVALVLGLLVASTKSSFDTRTAEIQQIGARVIQLDGILRRFGPEAAEPRRFLREVVAHRAEHSWGEDLVNAQAGGVTEEVTREARLERFIDQIHALPGNTEEQQWLRGRALQLTTETVSTRLLWAQQAGSSISVALLIILVFWLAVIFASVGLFAPRNATVATVVALCAVSVSTAVFFILSLDLPFSGLIQLSREPFRLALRYLDQ